MKFIRKIPVFLLAIFMVFAVAACENTPSNAGENTNGSQSQYKDPNEDFGYYDNKSYNEYLLGDDAVIDNQWEGYGIGDPFIMRHDGKYYLYCSSLDSEMGVRAYISANLTDWAPVTGEGLKEGYVSEDSVTAAAYAPEVYYFNGTFYMYTSPAGAGHYVLTSDKPEGPFVKATNNFGLNIDGSVLIDDDEKMYFTYADDGGIHMSRMEDMLTVPVSAMLNNTSIGGWTEGPYILKRDGIYYLTYTGNHVASDGYRIAYSTASSLPAGSLRNAFKRAVNNPLAIGTETELKGVGHSATVLGPDMDSHYLVYHYLNSSGGPNRSLGIDRLIFNGKLMSVEPRLTGSIKPTLPEFYSQGLDEQKFDNADGTALSKQSANADFTAEFNVTGAQSSTVVFGYKDANNYFSVVTDLADKTVKLNKVTAGAVNEIAAGTLVNDFSSSVLHTVRVSVRNGKADVSFDNMVKIDNAEITVSAGKIGYKDLPDGAEIGYTAFSNVAMGMSDEREAKQAEGYIGADNYLRDNEYTSAYKLGASSKVSVIEDGVFEGVKEIKFGASGDYASYLVSFAEGGRYGLELVYNKSYGGKKIGVKLTDGTVYRCTLPTVNMSEDNYTSGDYVRAIVGEFEVSKGIRPVRLENVGGEISYVAFRFVKTSAATPVYEQALSDYAANGADYKTIWKIRDGGHYAKAGTRQLVYFGDNTITDFTLNVEIKLDGATGTSTAGIVFHARNYAASSHDSYRSIQGYYLAVNNNQLVLERLNYADGSTDIKVVGGDVNPFKTSDVFVPLKIVSRGNSVTVWSGETKLMEVSDGWAFTSGKLGLYTNGAAAVFRNLKVSA